MFKSYHIIFITEVIPIEGVRQQQGHTTTPGTPCPTLFEQCVGSFTSRKTVNNEELQEGAYSFSSLSEKTRECNHLQMQLQRQYFLLSHLKTLSGGPARVRIHDLPRGCPILWLSWIFRWHG